MHIEPGLIAPMKVMAANAAAVGVLAYYAKAHIKQPANIVRTLVAAIFFSIFMQSFHLQVGSSELHFVGAIAMYLTLGFIPTLFGFAFGLLLQGVLFDAHDLPHLAVNSLSLIVPLIAAHMTIGKHMLNQATDLRWQEIVRLDAAYYAGVALMVGFWLAISNVQVPVLAWATFASSYLALVLCEPLFTLATVRLLKQHGDKTWVQYCFAVAVKH